MCCCPLRLRPEQRGLEILLKEHISRNKEKEKNKEKNKLRKKDTKNPPPANFSSRYNAQNAALKERT